MGQRGHRGAGTGVHGTPPSTAPAQARQHTEAQGVGEMGLRASSGLEALRVRWDPAGVAWASTVAALCVPPTTQACTPLPLQVQEFAPSR